MVRPSYLSGLTDEEYRAFVLWQQSGVQNEFAFPAPEGCRSHEDWIRHGAECWRRLRAKVYRSLPTAWDSPMLAVRS